MRPIDIARKIGMSTSALRHYESWGLIPPVPRTTSKHRMYSLEHLAYFECIRNMGEGFGMKLTGAVIGRIRNGEIDEALWIINDGQARKNQDKQIALRAVSMLENTDKSKGEQNGSLLPEFFTIKEIAQNTGIPASAIRYWNQIELFDVERNQTNGYRLFNAEVLKQIVLIKTLRNSGYNIPTIKKLLCEVREQNVSLAIQIAKSALEEMNNTLRKQLIGMHYLYKLLRELDHIR